MVSGIGAATTAEEYGHGSRKDLIRRVFPIMAVVVLVSE